MKKRPRDPSDDPRTRWRVATLLCLLISLLAGLYLNHATRMGWPAGDSEPLRGSEVAVVVPQAALPPSFSLLVTEGDQRAAIEPLVHALGFDLLERRTAHDDLVAFVLEHRQVATRPEAGTVWLLDLPEHTVVVDPDGRLVNHLLAQPTASATWPAAVHIIHWEDRTESSTVDTLPRPDAPLPSEDGLAGVEVALRAAGIDPLLLTTPRTGDALRLRYPGT